MRQLADIVPALYDRHIVEAGLAPQFFLLASFLVTFVLVRLTTHAIRRGVRAPLLGNVGRGDLHVHHLVVGILLLLVSGYLLIALDSDHRQLLAVPFGAGAALTLDEFALWLNLRDVYWAKEGRVSIDAIVIFASSIALLMVTGRFLIELGREIARMST